MAAPHAAGRGRGPEVRPYTQPGARIERLHRSEEIRAVFDKGRRLHGRSMTVVARRAEPAGRPRAAVVAGRRVGGAVARNQVKRRLRAALRASAVPPGFDVVVVARPGAAAAPFADLAGELDALLAHAAAQLAADGATA